MTTDTYAVIDRWSGKVRQRGGPRAGLWHVRHTPFYCSVHLRPFATHLNTFGQVKPLAREPAATHSPPAMSVEALQTLLVIAGWMVSFLLGRELATGFLQWRERSARSTVIDPQSQLDRDRRPRS
ncbi:MAG: hypothetical protein NVSMB2_07800 [Chloroflexota bacterium]